MTYSCGKLNQTALDRIRKKREAVEAAKSERRIS
jgi:hypothetical protein